MVNRATELLLRFVDERGRADVREMLHKIRIDQGGVIQITPEAMDLFNAAAEDAPHVRYASTVSAGPAPAPARLGRKIRSPYAAMTAAMYATLWGITSRHPQRYPYARLTRPTQERIEAALGHPVDDTTNDGVVPTLSMVWGRILWAGEGDHLDLLGHFQDDVTPRRHIDWLTSGSRFTRARFESLLDAVASFLLERG